jgi:hypothetical protein
MPPRRPAENDAPRSLPWTVHFPLDGGYRAADLEHPAPLPRVGETLEYIDETGQRRLYRVIEVVHSLQSAADTRPLVSEGEGSPNTTPRLGHAAEQPGGEGLVRAGLPRVYLAAADIEPEGESTMEKKTDLDAGAYIGREPELASETIPGGVRPDDERVAAGETQAGPREAPEPQGHREGSGRTDDDARDAGERR